MAVLLTLCYQLKGNTAMPNSISKYERWYYNIVNNAKCQPRNSDKEYYENHHIIPRSLGGDDRPENLVRLTYREHILCHWLLYKFSLDENKSKTAHAFWAMCNLRSKHNKRKIPPLRVLEAARIAHIQSLRETMSGSNNPMANRKGSFTGKKHSKEHIESISGEGNPMYGKTHTEESRQKISKSKIGKSRLPFSEETRQKMSKNRTGRKRRYDEDGTWHWHYPEV